VFNEPIFDRRSTLQNGMEGKVPIYILAEPLYTLREIIGFVVFLKIIGNWRTEDMI
jgi:hypothetical protein